ncbi:MAG: hypothetical protein RLZZ341_1217 [Pseudomonadota bacterium]|jgi:hypothetical protein
MSAPQHPNRRQLLQAGAAWSYLAPAWARAAAGAPRVALVVGNGAYPDAPLDNPANDARAMAERLGGLGFEVLALRDARREQMLEAVQRLGSALARAPEGVGLLYYAGHGLQLDARNFMVPVDARLGSAADIARQTVDVGEVIAAFRKAATRVNIVVLDACRDNPFGGITSGRGLAPLDAPAGTFLAYATAPGNVASDGEAGSSHGLYTQHLLTELARPQARIEDVFKRVRFAVRRASKGAQIPWESTSLEDDFVFQQAQVVAAAPPPPQVLRQRFDAQAEAWDRIKDSRNPEDFFAFLQAHPTGPVAEAAHARLNQLARPALQVQEPGGTLQSFEVGRFLEGDRFEMLNRTRGLPGGGAPVRVVYQVRRVTPQRIEIDVDNSGMPAGQRRQLQVMDGAGGIVAMGEAMRFDPPQRLLPGGLLQVGERWESVARITQPSGALSGHLTRRGRITGREALQLPAGRFDTYRCESVETYLMPGVPEIPSTVVHWMSPGLALPVRTETRVRVPGLPTEIVNESELVALVRGR